MSSKFPLPLKDLKAEADQFWRLLDEYLKQVNPTEAEEWKKNFMECNRAMIQKFSLKDLEDITKNTLKHFNEPEPSGEVYSQSAASSLTMALRILAPLVALAAAGNATELDTTSDLAELGTLREAFSNSFLMILVTELGAWCLRKFSRLRPKDQEPAELDIWTPGVMPSAPSRPRHILHKSYAREQSGGGTTDVRRPIRPDSEEAYDVDPVLALDDFTVALPDGFPDHAHRGFVTLTYLLPDSPGDLSHEDFLGNVGILKPGDAQWMTCGRGIVHSEVPSTEFFARGLQLWINLPEKEKMSPPRYLELPRAEQQRLVCDGVRCALLAGEALNASALDVDSLVAHFVMEPNSTLHQMIPEGHNAFVYILDGEGIFAGETADRHHCLILSHEVGEDGLVVRTAATAVSFFIFAAKPLREPVVWQGPFVMCSDEQIRQSMLDYQCGRNGFENANSWSDKTFFIAALLAMRHDRLSVFFGAAGALAAMTALSATIGLVLPKVMPRKYTHWAAVGLFVYFGAKLLLEALQMLRSGSGSGLMSCERYLLGVSKQDIWLTWSTCNSFL
eukprot:symbB.v1.2.027497.t4/scaffold2828.1/size70857/2